MNRKMQTSINRMRCCWCYFIFERIRSTWLSYRSYSYYTMCLVVFYLAVGCVYAGSIRGQLTVFHKGGKKLLREFSNGIVYLDGLKTSPPKTPAISRQAGKDFTPRLLPVVVGQVIEFWNNDKVQHNVFCKDKRKTFDLGRYPQEEFRVESFDTPGFYKIYCNIHQRMISDVVVLENKFYSTTDDEGNFTIDNIPVGSYILRAWHIYGGQSQQPVAVKADDEQIVNMSVTSKKVLRQLLRHKNKFGRSYKSSEDY